MMRFLYLSMQIVAIYSLVQGLLRIAIDPHTMIFRTSSWCKILSYSRFYCPGIFYGLYLFQILLRLSASFHGTYLALSKFTLYTLGTLTLIIPILASIILIIDGGGAECIRSWAPPDLDLNITFCTVPPDLSMLFKYYIADGLVLLTNALNITFGVMFTIKLRQFVNMRQTSNPSPSASSKRIKFEALIIKNNILTIFGIISTTTSYALFVVTQLNFPMQLDSFINCCVVGLMFSCNERHYQRIYSPLIRCCFRRCDPYYSDSSGVVMSSPSIASDDNIAEITCKTDARLH